MHLHHKLLQLSAVIFIFLCVSAHATVLESDDFENGFGSWSNVSSGDSKDWSRKSGGTSSYGTGPAGGANGSEYYVYLETSSGFAYTAGDTAILQGPAIGAGDIHLSFDYHMFGPDTGTLAVDVLSGGSWLQDVWTISGQQQTSNSALYTSVDIDLTAYSVSRIRFRATAVGGYTGDIAIDNLQIESISPAGPVAPEFASDPFTKPDAVQDQPYSESITADASDTNGDSLSFSKLSGPAWLNVASDGSLSGTPSGIDLGDNSFVVEVSDGVLQSSATLNIYVGDGFVPQVISVSGFESLFSDWSNVSVGDNTDWTRYSGSTPSTGTGPAGGADGSNYFMYLETSSGNAYSAGDTAILESKTITGASNISLNFQYHMYGNDTGTLSVDVFDGNTWINDAWSIFGQQHLSSTDAYTLANVDLNSYMIEKLRFRATAIGGYTGDIAIDNVEILGSGSIDASTPSKIAFVTNQGYMGNFGGLSGADAICQAQANTVGLSGTFKAFLSDNNTSAATRLNHSTVPYIRVDGTVIANNWADLVDGRISNPLNVTASGTTVSGYAWTGSDADGSKATYYPGDYPSGYNLDLTCSNWSMNTSSFHYLGARGNVGDPYAWSDWWQNDGSPCSNSLRLYCLEQ